jgi:hydrogenase nickel incorporation protein HypB
MPSLIPTSSLPTFFELGDEVAIANRQALHECSVLAVSMIGAPSCGKSALIKSSIERLRAAGTHAQAIPAGRSAAPAKRESYHGKGVIGPTGVDRAEPGHVHDAISALDLPSLDVLFIEATTADTKACDVDLGQELRVAVFAADCEASLPADQADLISKADAVVLTKKDLLSDCAREKLEQVRSAVRRSNPTARVFEVSPRTGQGMDEWAEWLLHRAPHLREQTSDWFG